MFVLDNVPRGQVQADFGSALMRKFDRMFDEAMVLYQIALNEYIVHLVGHDTLQLFGFEQGCCAEVGREGALASLRDKSVGHPGGQGGVVQGNEMHAALLRLCV